MKIAVLGTGMVGNAIATRLVQVGHQVMMGSREAGSQAGQQWLRSIGGTAQAGTFADAATFGELAFDCTSGAHSLEALRSAGAANLRGKILIQVSNPLQDSSGKLSMLTTCNTDSLGEQVQRELPETRVVKALNTVNCQIMVQPSLVPGDHNLFICGNDAAAKAEVAKYICDWFGWKTENIIDLGDISGSRGTEMFLPLWIRLWGVMGSPLFNIHVGTANRTSNPVVTQTATDNVAVVRQLYEARGNPEIIRRVLADDVRWEVTEGFPFSTTYVGRDQVLGFFTRLFTEFEEWRTEPADFFAADPHVTAIGVYSARAKKTGKTFRARFMHVLTLKEGVITHLRQVADTAQIAHALEAAEESHSRADAR